MEELWCWDPGRRCWTIWLDDGSFVAHYSQRQETPWDTPGRHHRQSGSKDTKGCSRSSDTLHCQPVGAGTDWWGPGAESRALGGAGSPPWSKKSDRCGIIWLFANGPSATPTWTDGSSVKASCGHSRCHQSCEFSQPSSFCPGCLSLAGANILWFEGELTRQLSLKQTILNVLLFHYYALFPGRDEEGHHSMSYNF